MEEVEAPSENRGENPKRLGRFEVIRPLGNGGMGSVFLTRDPALERQVAVKVLAGHSSADGRQRLLREARALAQLNHPHVIQVYEVGLVGEQVFLAMEFVDGPTLRAWCEAPRSWAELMEVFMAAGRGLAAAHAAGIVHRDFKPDNVIVGLDGRVRVLDFGLARSDQSETDPATYADAPTRPSGLEDTLPSGLNAEGRLTRTGAVLGTPAFMSPEQHDGQPVDHRSDQFSFAVVLWLALYGQRPFAGDTLVQVAFSTVLGRVKPPPPDHGRPPEAEAVLRRALSAQPDARFEDMDGLLSALSAIQSGTEAPGSGRAGPGWATFARAPSNPALIGRRYEAFEKAEQHGAYRAVDRLGGGVVTVIALPGGGTRAAMAERLRSIASLRHPNLARILDYGLDEAGAPFVVEEPLETAEDLVTHARDSSPRLQASLLAQLFRGLEYLHRRQLVHGRVDRSTVRVLDGRVKLSGLGGALFSDQRPPIEADLEGASSIAEALGFCDPSGNPLSGMLETATGARAALGRLAETFGDVAGAETHETRESALQSVPLVGRSPQVATLEQRLDRAVEGKGGLVLIGGESGVGKSRLVEELRAIALARGAILVQGQADAEQRYPYCVWRRVMGWLALLGRPDPLTAGVLASHVPDIERLVDHSVAPPPALDAASEQSRLTRAVLACFERIEAPMVILLEDLHWMRPESERLLAEVAAQLGARKVLLVGSFREDERPELARLHQAELLRLERLEKDAVCALCAAAIGSEQPRLGEMLFHETEGNPFFVLEMLRELAEELGGLDGIRGSTLPPRLPAGGTFRVLARRLNRVQPWARPLLELAAVAGRDLDLGLLEELDRTEPEPVGLADWLEHGAAAAVLDPEPRWRFAHDKLREHLIGSLPPERLQVRFAQVAAAVERRTAGSGDAAMLLARLYRSARDPAGEARFAGLAGTRALEVGSSAEAIGFLERALGLAPSDRPPAETARLQRLLGEARYLAGDQPGALDALERAVAVVAPALPRRTFPLAVRAVVELLRHLTAVSWFTRGAAPAALREASLASGRVANLATYRGEALRVITASLTSSNLADRAGFTNAYGLGVMGYSAAYLGAVGIAERFFARARAGAEAEGDLQSLVEVTQMECVLLAGTGAFERAFSLIDAGRGAAEKAGFQLGVDLSVAFSATLHALTGDLRRWESGIVASKRNLSKPEHLHSVLCQEVHLRVLTGELDQAERLIKQEIPAVPCDYPLGDLLAAAAAASLAAVAGDAAQAAKRVEEKLATGIAVPPIVAPFVYGGLSDALCAALPEHRFAARSAARLSRRLNRAAQSFATLAPENERLRAALARHRRDLPGAARALKRAADAAERIGRRLEWGLALRSLSELGGPEAEAHGARAQVLRLEAGYRAEGSSALAARLTSAT